MGNKNFQYDLDIFVRENDRKNFGSNEKQKLLLKNDQGRPIIGYIVINIFLYFNTKKNDHILFFLHI